MEVELRPSSSSQRHAECIRGVCKNISRSGCGVIGPAAPRVGDVYRMEIPDAAAHALHGSHVRCVRCQLLDEDLFESGFCFLSPLAAAATQPQATPAADVVDPLA
jgi:hypothetical protein